MTSPWFDNRSWCTTRAHRGSRAMGAARSSVMPRERLANGGGGLVQPLLHALSGAIDDCYWMDRDRTDGDMAQATPLEEFGRR